MRWTSFFTYLSIASLVGAVASQVAGWTDVREWFLLAWTVLLLPVAIGLFAHPMRSPSTGLFIGFWGVVAVLALIVLQALTVADVIRGSVAGQWTALPLAVVGIWILVASALGFGAKPFSALFDLLGILTGAGFITIGLATWGGNADVLRAAGVAAAVAYVMWAAGVGWVFFGLRRTSRSFQSVAIGPVPSGPSGHLPT
jgi:hypothetical protein